MAELTSISALADAITPDGTELIPIDQDGQTVKIDLSSLVAGGMTTGTNTHGRWIRFANGTQICTMLAEANSLPLTVAAAGGYRNGTTSFTWPKPFSGSPEVSVSAEGNLNALPLGASRGATSTDVYWWRVDSVTVDVKASVIGIGTWS